MKIFTKPYWIFLTVTIPQILIIFYYLGIYGVISSLLESRHLDYWFLYGIILGLLIIASSAYAVFLQARKQSIHWLYALLSLVGYVIFLYAYFRGAHRMMPFDIPRWMIPAEEAYLLPVGLIMPALMHALLLLVDRFTPAGEKSRLVLTTVGVIALPAFWYLLFRFGIPLLHGKMSWALLEHIRMVIFVILTVAFMFVLLRLTYILMLKLQQSKLRNAWLLKTPFTLLLPLLCLLFYNGVITTGTTGEFLAEFNPLGDWSHPVYYVLVILNGLLLTLPPARLKTVRLGGFALKALLYPFVVYFFVVFLPFFPFAVSAVVLLGLGFLLLAPLILFIFHTRSLYDDWRVLGKSSDPKVPALVFLTAFAAFPAGVTISYSMDRATLNSMLTHVYAPDYLSESTLRLDMDSARRVLDNISSVKEGENFLSGKRKPYLTTYYQWLVLDNLTVSDRRLNELERVFFGASAAATESEPTPAGGTDAPELTKVETSTALSDDGRYYKSQVDLTMTYEGRGNGEYVTRFHLPVGAWITDYYLVIGGEKVPGILSEKKSALWLYQQIRNTRRDPGIIYYTSPEELILRVFPFSKGESRQTGFEILHRGPLVFDIDGVRIALQAEPRRSSADDKSNFVVVSPGEKAALAKQTRKPYLHFILDRSSLAGGQFDDYSDLVNNLIAKGEVHGVDVEGARVTATGYAAKTFPLGQDWETKARRFEGEGGFFLERAVKKALYRHYRQQPDSYPVFVVVSDHIDEAVFTEGLQDFGMTMPEGDMFLVLDTKQGLRARRFATPMQDIAPSKAIAPGTRQVLAWPDDSRPVAYLPDDGRASLVTRDPEQDGFDLTLEEGSWENGAKLYGLWLSSRLNPREAGQKHYSVITNSFRTHLLTPLTAFVSPENDAQRQTLRKKQQQMLSSRRPLDIGDENVMDEPPLWVLLLFLAILLLSGRHRAVARRNPGRFVRGQR